MCQCGGELGFAGESLRREEAREMGWARPVDLPEVPRNGPEMT